MGPQPHSRPSHRARLETFAKSRAERLRLAFRLAGLNAQSYAARGEGLGGPLIEAKDPRALDELFTELNELRGVSPRT